MIDRAKTEVGAAQETVWRSLYELEATGQSGFEGFLGSLLSEVTGEPFHVVKSGTQSGSDVRSERCNLVSFVLESKQYDHGTRLSLDSLLQKLFDASTAEAAADVWILATTRGIDSSYREKLGSVGEGLGIDVIVWDWPEHSAALADLAVLCALAPDACASHLGSASSLSESLRTIGEHAEFERRASWWRDRLLRPEVGYATCSEQCGLWLEEAQSSEANARSRLGGLHNLRTSRYGVVTRRAVSEGLSLWFQDGEAGIAALVGDEGTGKSWAALDWCGGVSLVNGVAPVLVYIPATRISGREAKSDIADALSKQVGKEAGFWRRRLGLWERVGGDGLRVLVVVDGLNQNFLFKEWADWLQPLLEEDVRTMYRVVVTCWPNWWREQLRGLVNLEPTPVEVEVKAFDDCELDTMLVNMGLTRADFTESVLDLMRVPRLSTVVMAHRKALAESGDVTAERVIYEDWKDRIRRDSSPRGLDDARMKVFVSELGKELQKDIDRSVSGRNIREILSHESGKSGEELDAAVVQLTSGRWLLAGNRPDTFKLDTDKLPYVLGVALTAELKSQSGSSDAGVTIAEFLDPLKAHSLGAKILCAATTIALVEKDTPDVVRSVLLARWLDEPNFGREDFESLWRVVGLDATVFLAIAEGYWLSEKASEFQDEVLVKACANAADFPRFDATLKGKLAEWLGAVWLGPAIAEADHSAGTGGGGQDDVRLRLREWEGSGASRSFERVVLREDGAWNWVGQRAVAVISFLRRAPYVAALEAWCLSGALVARVPHFDDVAWLLRANRKDPGETDAAMAAIVRRFERHRSPVCRRAAAIARDAMSHVRRDRVGRSHGTREVGDSESPPHEVDAAALDRDALFQAVQDYLGPGGWKGCSADAGVALIDELVKRGLSAGSREVDLLLAYVGEVVSIVSPQARRHLAAAFERGRVQTVVSGGKPRLAADFAGAALVMRLYEATAQEQCRLLLASEKEAIGPEWWPICRRATERDLEGLDFDGASREGLVLWLEFFGGRLDKALIPKLGILGSLVTSEQQEVRRRAVEMAAHGRHMEALERFSRSDYAAPVSDESRAGFLEEYARNRALLALEVQNGPDSRMSSECAGLRVKFTEEDGPTDAGLDDFARYLERELDTAWTATSWSAPRFWFSYRECIELLIGRDKSAVQALLRPWAGEIKAFQAECALMSDFPVLDAARALKHEAPDLTLGVCQSLRTASKDSIVSANVTVELPFELRRSETSDAACEEILAGTTTDQELLQVAYLCHRHGRVDWLVEQVTGLESSSRAADVAKALTLLGFFDSNEEADLLWQEFGSRPPKDRWLARVFDASWVEYVRNRIARAEFRRFWQALDENEARHAWKRLEEQCDRRIGLWIKEIDPPLADAPFARRLVRSLMSKSLNKAVEKHGEGRKRLLFHTRIGSPGMAPWGE